MESEYNSEDSFMESVLDPSDSYNEDSNMEEGVYGAFQIEDEENVEVDDSDLSSGDIPGGEDTEWKPDPSVPEGWTIREFLTKNGQKLEHVKSPSGVFFPGRRAAMEWMKGQGFSDDDIVQMQSRLKIRWLENHPSVPPGWKTRSTKIKTNNGITNMEWFLSPSGKMFRGKKAILKAIKNDPSNFADEEIRKFKSVPVPVKKFSAEYNWREDDPTIPPGWRSAIINMNSFGKIVESTRFLAPDGRFCTSRVEAIKYLMKEEEMNREELHTMREGLISDGWLSSPFLPQNWFMKPDRCRGKRKEAHYNYLSADMQHHRSTKAAVAFLSADPRYNQDDIDNLLKLTKDEGKKLRPDKYDWMEGNESVPDGWKIRVVHCTNGLDREFFLSPDGSSFSGRKQALEYLKTGGGSPDDIRRMESGCKIVWTEEDPTLPPGWKTRSSEINTRTGKVPMQWFLSPDGKMYRGRKSALEEIQSSGQYSTLEIRRFKFVIPENKKTNYTWGEDTSVPPGWLTTVITMNSFGKLVQSKRFMAPDGRFCSSRDEAIKYMVKEGLYSDEEIEIMEGGYEEDMEQMDVKMEGWGMDGEDGSAKRKYIPELKEITKKMKKEEVDIKEEAMSDYDEEPETSFKIEKNDEDDDDQDMDFVPKLRIRKTSSRKSTPTKSGRKNSRASLSDSKDGPAMAKDEGWIDDDLSVPEGWKTKEYTNKGGQNVKHITSPSGIFFAGRKAALEHMESSNEYSAEDMELMQSGLKVFWGEDDLTMPEGWKTRITDIKTKAGITQMQWFRSPEGKIFRGRKSALKFLESSQDYSNEDIRNFKSKPAAEKKFSKEYDWLEDDPNIPPGWKSTVIQMNSFGKIVPSMRFLAPDGRYCSNRIDALKYMVREGIFTTEDIEIMKGGLIMDGWRQDDKLPDNWFMKPRKDKINEATASYHYLADTFQQFDSTKSAVKYMLTRPDQYHPQDVAKLEMKVNAEAKKLCPDKYDWLECKDTLPKGWKYRTVVCTNGLERHFFLAPDGSSYSGRKQAVEYMKKGEFKPEDIKKMESGFKIKWVDNDPDLPAGWKCRTTDMKTKNGVIPMQWYMSPEGKMFRGKKSAVEYISNCGMYSKDEICKFRCSGDTPTKTQYDWNENDPSVPDGWKTTMITVNSFGKIVKSKRYLSPDGRFCSSRIDSLKYMAKVNIFPNDDVEKMKNGLLLEGWEIEPMLPEGWLLKPDKHKEEEATFNYLTPDYQFLRSTRAAQNLMHNSPLYSEEDVSKLGTLIAEERRKIRMDKYGGTKQSTLPTGWKLSASEGNSCIVAPDGARFETRLQALIHLIKDGCDKTVIEEMRKNLKHEGWEDNNILPKGWKMLKVESESDMVFLSESGEVFETLESVLEEMENNSTYKDTELENIRALYENQTKAIKQNSTKYEWTEDDQTVPTGWKTRTVDGKVRKKFYLSPDSSVFACRRSCLQHMIKENFSETEIEEMREMLSHEGWSKVEFLPEKWLIRKSEGSTNGIYDVDFWILNNKAVVFRSTKAATEFMAASEEYTQEDIDKIISNLETERKKARQLKYDWLDGDETVPAGWKVRFVEGKTRKTFFLSEDGCQFACRRSGLQHMINENAPAEALESMREKLRFEGWENDDHLPEGWKVRKSEGSTNGMFDVNYYYLSKEGIMFHSTKAVISYMTNSPIYSQEDIARIKTRLEVETRKNRPQKYDWLEDENLPPGWKYRTIIKAGIRTDYVITETGAQFQSRRAAIEYMIKEEYEPQTIYRMWSTLETEGWVTDNDRLPKGWRVRSKERLKDNWQFYFLSPQMEIFKSNKAVLDFISAQKDTYTEDDFHRVKLWIEEEQRSRREENYTWDEEPNLPPGWKVRSVITNSKNIREFFLTPEGDQIAGRKKAIEVMQSQGASKSIIDAQTKKMKQVSFRNQNKRPEDLVQEPDVETLISEPQTYFSSDDETEMEDMRMFENDDGSNHIDLGGLEPEFEPVEITAVDYDEDVDDVDVDEDDEFNDVEEITDESYSQDNSGVVQSENIKVEPDINLIMSSRI